MSINIYSLSRQLGKVLSAAGLKLATAESCTGGGIGWEITRILGSSAWFECGFVTYSNQSKIDLLGVQARSLEQHGAVSECVAREMALGALKKSHADIAISVTGIAGPSGGTLSKPVGLVWFGLARKNADCECRSVVFSGSRARIRRSAIAYGLQWLLEAT